ncbi:hypothetical protein DRP04_05915 [Archaeoglobales archaeon]|nr:MAG: hypothetical protein DRP04_05915 [Archaeoglobales archaeon]
MRVRVWVKPKRCPNCGGRIYSVKSHAIFIGQKKVENVVCVYFDCECRYCGWKGAVFPREKQF